MIPSFQSSPAQSPESGAPTQPVPRAPSKLRKKQIVLAVAMLALFGVADRTLRAHLFTIGQFEPVPQGTLARLPLQIGEWTGKDLEVDPNVIRATDTDDHVNRTYRKSVTGQPLSLWFACGVRMRDLLPHRPEVCYPSAGWTISGNESIELASDDQPFRAQRLRLYRGGVDAMTATVLSYYMINDRPFDDVSALRSLAWRASAARTTVAQIQIAVFSDPTNPVDENRLMEFAEAASAPIRDVLRPLSNLPAEKGGAP